MPDASASVARVRRTRQRGFTLVEVLVALTIMAVLSTMAWQGIDAMARTREASNAAVERTLRIQTALAQWEHDLRALDNTRTVPPLNFDGATLRLTRVADGGVQLVTWSLRAGAWWRWASPAVTSVDALQEHWLRSQQLLGNEPGTLRVMDGATGMQVYFYRGNGWANAQSAADLAAAPPPAAAAAAAASAPAPAPARLVEQLPTGVRLLLTLGQGPLTRDIALPPQMP
jgi:general secretion pathway protein J